MIFGSGVNEVNRGIDEKKKGGCYIPTSVATKNVNHSAKKVNI